MGDGWRHTILIEKDRGRRGRCQVSPVHCRGACLPAGGLRWAGLRGDFVDAIQNREGQAALGTTGVADGEFDPEEFDLEAVVEELRAG